MCKRELIMHVIPHVYIKRILIEKDNFIFYVVGSVFPTQTI
jgi:hypothetical protein